MKKELFNYDNGKTKMNYAVYTPENYKDLPLVIYLHGAGERGTDITHLDRHGVSKLLSDGKEYPAVILTPQCPADRVWDNVVSELKEIIDKVALQYEIKADRIALTGSSMGGFGTWMMGMTYPNFFSVIVPVAGGGMSWRTTNLKTTPVIAYHGGSDSVVPPVYSQLCVDGVNRNGGTAELIILDGMEHNDGINYAYRETNLMERIVKYRRTDFDAVPEFCSQLF
ncbi:MAG: hypothetical protein E7565_05470 [Ruminococcaceae bacterium]|nr:hypothetical protein [Oscillospiraceae bacterium]